MPWNGSAPNKTFQRSDGTRTGTQVWQQAEADGVDIVSNDHDTHDQDLANAINATLLKDGGNTPSANLPMGGLKHTNVADASSTNEYATLGQSIANGGIYVATVGGTANAITLTTGLSLTSLDHGSEFSFIVAATNTGAATVTIDSVSAVALKRQELEDLSAGDLYEGAIAVIKYDGTQFQLLNRRVIDGGGGGGSSLTGAEIVEAINVELGASTWQEGNDGTTAPQLAYDSQDARVSGFATSNSGGARYRCHWTADGRIVLYGDQSAFAYDPAGDNWGPYEIPVPWDTSTVSIEAIYCGLNYILVQTNESTGNLYHMGSSANGQGGNGGTTAVTSLTRITKFSTDAVKISTVKTEANRGNTEAFWFAITTAGTVYSCGYSGVQQVMGYNNTANLATPRKMTLSDGTTVLSNVVEITCDTAYAPVAARLSTGKAYIWGAGTDGAHGQNSTSALTWPTVIQTAFGSGVDRTDIAKIIPTGSSGTATRAVTWLLTTAGKIEVSGSRNFGNGDGSALLSAAINTFQPATGAIAALTVSSIYAGGGEYYVCLAITSTGTGYLCGYMGSYALLGNGSTTNLNTFTLLSGLPTGFSGNLTSAKIRGGSTSATVSVVLEATISGVKTLASIGYDGHYNTGKNVSGISAASQTWGLVQGVRGTISSWQTVGDATFYGIEVLNAYGELRYCGANDQGQAGTQPGNLHDVPILQTCRLIGPRLLKPWTNRGAYSSSTEYSYNDTVTDNGSTWLYINLTASTGQALPTLPTTSNTYWRIAAQKGDAGFANIVFDFDGGTSTLTSGMKARIPVSFDATIRSATLIADTTGSIVIDVWKDTYANYPPTVADTITASAKPTLSSAQKYTDSTLTGWTTTITAGDILFANIDSVSGITNAVLTLKVQRS